VRRRLFVAVALGERARSACATLAARLRDTPFVARWTVPENYHLTVAFLGGIDAERVVLVEDVLRAAAPALAPFDVPLDAVGGFPNARRPRVVWAGPSRAVAGFRALCAAVRAPLARLGFSFDPHDDAHVTLARADGAAALPPIAPPRALQRVDALTLFESFTERAGPRYVALARFGFGAGAASEAPGRERSTR